MRHSLSLVERPPACSGPQAVILSDALKCWKVHGANKRAIPYDIQSGTCIAPTTSFQYLEYLFPRMELEESGAEVGGFQRTLKDLFAGAAGGIAQVLLGQSIPICLP